MKNLPEQLWIFLGSLVFFLLTLSENFSGPHDSITYLNGIVDGYPLVNQHHLLYHYSAYCWLQFWQLILPSVKDYFIVESFSAIFGSLTIAVAYSFFRNRFGFSKFVALTSIFPIAFSYGCWFYSVNVEVYAPPLFFVLMALYLITKDKLSSRDWYGIVLLHIMAVLFHQINILFGVVIIWKLWQQRSSIPVAKWLLFYVVNGIVFVGSAYFIVGWIVEKQNSIPKWISWIRGYAGSDTYWHALNLKTPVNVAYGFSHAFLGGHYIFQIPWVKEILSSSLSAHSLADEMYISRSIQPSIAIFLTILTLILGLLMLWLSVRMIRNFKTIWRVKKLIVLPTILCFLTYSGFFIFWMPEILEFWILQTVLVWFLLLGTMNIGAPFRIKPLWTSVSLGMLLFCINFFGSIRWMQNKEYDLYYVKTKNVRALATSNDLIILQDGWLLKDFVHYFTEIPFVEAPLKESLKLKVDSAVTKTLKGGGNLLIIPEIHDHKRVSDTNYLDSLRTVYRDRIRQIRKDEPEVWQIQ